MRTNGLDPVEVSTIQAYNLDAESELENTPVGSVGQDLRHALSLAGPNPSVLDVGCGFGRVLTYLRQCGNFSYTGIDPSEEMLKIGRRQFPEADFREMNLYELPHEFPTTKFDLVIAISTLFHVPPRKMGTALASLKSVMRTNGAGLFTFMNVNETVYIRDGQLRRPNFPGPLMTDYGGPVETIIPQLVRAGFAPQGIYQYMNTPLYAVVLVSV